MDRRDFIKSGLLAVAIGAMNGPKVLAQEAERQAARDELSKDILNYNPQMQYRPMGRTGVNVSALGFGMLRLPMKNGHVDFDQTTPMVRRAIEGGVNYIDTGRVYLGGESEQAVGKALAGGWRDRVYVTSKMPWWEMQSADDFEKFFDQSRRVIGTDVIDFYHIHMIMHRAWKDYVLPYKLIEKMERLKAQGKIRFMGFSFHDSLQLFKKVVEYTPAWDFCLIQHNYLDYEYEAGVLGPKYAAANGMGLAVMKPVRTGFLANLPQPMREALARPGVGVGLSVGHPRSERGSERHGQHGGCGGEPEVCRQSPSQHAHPRRARGFGRGHLRLPPRTGAHRLHGLLPVHPLPAQRRHRLHLRLCVQQLHPAQKQRKGNGGLYRLDVARAARRPGILVHRLRRMSGEVPAAFGYSEPIGEGEGNNGEITLARLHDFPYLRKQLLK